MPKRRPQDSGGIVFHVLNRGVRRMQLFDRPGDYDAYLSLFAAGQRRTPMRCLAYCLMPNHFHFVLWPYEDRDLSDFMFWLSTIHARRWHLARGPGSNGHVYQGRFKALPVCADGHFLRVCRYVERNPVRAGLTSRAEDWAWSSFAQRIGRRRGILLADWPVQRPESWAEIINEPADPEAAEVRQAIRKSAPLGPELWRQLIANRLDMSSHLRPTGRPVRTKPGLIFQAP